MITIERLFIKFKERQVNRSVTVEDVVEPSLGSDNFRKPLIYRGTEALIKNILIILFGKPGFYPSIPELGLQIQSYRYQKFSDIDIAGLKAQICYQCSLLQLPFNKGDFDIEVGYINGDVNQPTILFTFRVYKDMHPQNILLGLKNDGDRVIYNYIEYDPGMSN